VEGCLFWESDFDNRRAAEGRRILRAAMGRSDAASSRLHFERRDDSAADSFARWERVFGALSAGRAFWVAVLLSATLSLPSHRGAKRLGRMAGSRRGYVLLVTWPRPDETADRGAGVGRQICALGASGSSSPPPSPSPASCFSIRACISAPIPIGWSTIFIPSGKPSWESRHDTGWETGKGDTDRSMIPMCSFQPGRDRA
jgi:hypothetical protein